MNNLNGKSILLIVSGGIAAYKALELIRLLRKQSAQVRCILTKGGERFVTPLSLASLSEQTVYTDMWSLKDETEMGHIRLSREADLVIVAPASANIIARMAHGLAEDLATTTLLAADKPVLIAPAMNHKMWLNPATQNNVETLKRRGIKLIGPEEGDMACGEHGPGRMSEPETILATAAAFFSNRPLKGKTALVTSGPTYEPLDPVRFIGNRSSGKQGHAIAQALADAGAQVTLISGPTALPDPPNLKTIHIETAQQMLNAAEKALPADIAVCAAAVGDWSPAKTQAAKIKKRAGGTPPDIKLKENPDILKTLTAHKNRPALVIGFAAETENLETSAREKLHRKNCDWIVANLIEPEDKNVFGSDKNHVYLITRSQTQDWTPTTKQAVAEKLTGEIINHFNTEKPLTHAAE